LFRVDGRTVDARQLPKRERGSVRLTDSALNEAIGDQYMSDPDVKYCDTIAQKRYMLASIMSPQKKRAGMRRT
jgi:hypothetical protein